MVGEQDHTRLEARRLLHGVGLGGDIALHCALLVHDEGLRIEGVGLHLALAEPVFGLQPLEVARDTFLGDQQRQRLEIFEFCNFGFRMGQENLRILLEDGGDRDQRHVVGDGVERLQRVRAHEEVELAGGQQDAVVGVGASRHDGDVEAVFLVAALGNRLEEAAMFGLRDPVGSKRHLVEGFRARGHQRRHQRQKTCG